MYVTVSRIARNTHDVVRKIGTPASRPSGMPARPRRCSCCCTVSMLRTVRAGRKFSSHPCPNLCAMTVDAVPPDVTELDVPEAERPSRPSLSPSRAADFKTCPLLYRFRSIDRLPEQPTADQARGTLVHAV